MGRLDNIIARNKPSMRPRERTLVSLAVGFAILLILGLAVFTDLGTPGGDPPAPKEREHRIDDVLLVGPRHADAGVDAPSSTGPSLR